MAYDADKTWDNFEREVQNLARQVIDTLYRCEEYYKDLIHYRGSKTNAEIATALSRNETDIDALEAAVLAMHRLYQFADGQSVAQHTYADDLRTFS